MLRWLCLRSTYYWGFSCTWKITIWWQYGDKGFNINDLLISQWIRISYSTIFEKETTISKEKLQKDIEHCKNQNTCWTSNWTGKRTFEFWNLAFPITMKDLLDDIVLICSAVTYLAPPLVPLWIKMKLELVFMVYSFVFNYRTPKWNQKIY